MTPKGSLQSSRHAAFSSAGFSEGLPSSSLTAAKLFRTSLLPCTNIEQTESPDTVHLQSTHPNHKHAAALRRSASLSMPAQASNEQADLMASGAHLSTHADAERSHGKSAGTPRASAARQNRHLQGNIQSADSHAPKGQHHARTGNGHTPQPVSLQQHSGGVPCEPWAMQDPLLGRSLTSKRPQQGTAVQHLNGLPAGMQRAKDSRSRSLPIAHSTPQQQEGIQAEVNDAMHRPQSLRPIRFSHAHRAQRASRQPAEQSADELAQSPLPPKLSRSSRSKTPEHNSSGREPLQPSSPLGSRNAAQPLSSSLRRSLQDVSAWVNRHAESSPESPPDAAEPVSASYAHDMHARRLPSEAPAERRMHRLSMNGWPTSPAHGSHADAASDASIAALSRMQAEAACLDLLGEQPVATQALPQVKGGRRRWGVGLETDVPLDEYAVLVAQQPWLEDAADKAAASAVRGYVLLFLPCIPGCCTPVNAIACKFMFGASTLVNVILALRHGLKCIIGPPGPCASGTETLACPISYMRW